MKKLSVWGLGAVVSLVLAGCGGGGDGDQSPRVRYSRLVTFGDSLSDVGSYRVGGVAAAGGGEYSVNGSSGVNWTELLAAQAGLPAPCAAQTGLASEVPGLPAVLPPVNHAECYGYAQGGSRVTNDIGIQNAVLPGIQLGQLTVPVVKQIQAHLAKGGGQFGSDELVVVLAGGNDALFNLGAIASSANPAGLTPTQAVTAVATAGGELGAYVKSLILAKGATRVVVLTLPDLSQTPFAYALDLPTQGLIHTMVTSFNDQLLAQLNGVAGVLVVDSYTQGRDQVANPAQYSLTNVTDTACDLEGMAAAGLAESSLFCSARTLRAGDVSRYEFADTVHPTPFGYQLLARYVFSQMARAGWL